MSAKDTATKAPKEPEAEKPAAKGAPPKESARIDRLERALTNGLSINLANYDDADQAEERKKQAEEAQKDAEKQAEEAAKAEEEAKKAADEEAVAAAKGE